MPFFGGLKFGFFAEMRWAAPPPAVGRRVGCGALCLGALAWWPSGSLLADRVIRCYNTKIDAFSTLPAAEAALERSLAERSYRYIHRKLSSGELRPGARLVNRILASEIGVSVIPVREAIHRLASEGLVQHIPGAGAFVRELSWQELDELYVLRDALESCAAEEASRHITEEQLQVLETIQQQMDCIQAEIVVCENEYATPALLNRWLDCEEEFHEVLVESARNRLLSKVVRDHRAVNQVFDAQRNDPKLLTAQLALKTCRDRWKLLQALRNRDATLSRQLISAQIQLGRKTVLEHFRANHSRRASM